MFHRWVKLPVAGQTDLLQPPGQAASLQQGKSWPETRLLARRQEIEKEREMVCGDKCDIQDGKS